jgi:hypothetical protein
MSNNPVQGDKKDIIREKINTGDRPIRGLRPGKPDIIYDEIDELPDEIVEQIYAGFAIPDGKDVIIIPASG